MSSVTDRRRHQRYPLSLAVILRRGTQVVDAQVINGSAGGCLVLSPVPFEVGDQVTASIPELNVPEAPMMVVRVHQQHASEWLVGMCFETSTLDEEQLEEIARQFQLHLKPDPLAN